MPLPAACNLKPNYVSLGVMSKIYGLAGKIFRDDKTIILNDVTHDPRHYGVVGEQIEVVVSFD